MAQRSVFRFSSMRLLPSVAPDQSKEQKPVPACAGDGMGDRTERSISSPVVGKAVLHDRDLDRTTPIAARQNGPDGREARIALGARGVASGKLGPKPARRP